MNRVCEVSIPSDSNISLYDGGVDFADAYMVKLPANNTSDPKQLAKFIFEQQVSWVMGLMNMRDMFIKMFGLKISTVKDLQRHDTEGVKRVGFFKIYSLFNNEIIMGEDDAHLDFRVSVLYQKAENTDDNQAQLIVSTVVLCHNALGRNYLRLIKPFHRLIAKSSLRKAAQQGFPVQKRGE